MRTGIVFGIRDEARIAGYVRELRFLFSKVPRLHRTLLRPKTLRAALRSGGDVHVAVLEERASKSGSKSSRILAVLGFETHTHSCGFRHVNVTSFYIFDRHADQISRTKFEEFVRKFCLERGIPVVSGYLSMSIPVDKYKVENGLPECLRCGACCMGYFDVILTTQDIEEGLEEQPGRPNVLRQKKNGICFYYRQNKGCTIYEKRPAACRRYSCR